MCTQFICKDGKYRYLYKITNNITKQYYYGIHTTKNLNDGYMGSGSRIKKDIKKLGPDNFTKEYIQFFSSNNDLKESERNILTQTILNDPLCYNVMKGGGGFNSTGLFPARNKITGEIMAIKRGEDYDKNIWVHITSGRKRISKLIEGIQVIKYIYEEYLDKYINDGWTTHSNGNVNGKIKINDGNIIKYINKNDLQQYLDDGWTRGGLSNSCKGRSRIIKNINGEICEKLVSQNDLQQYLDDGWTKGSIHTGRTHIYKDDEHKMIYQHELQQYLDDGWLTGTPCHSIKGRVKVVKDDVCKVIYPNELDKYMLDGWKKGSHGTTNGKIWINNGNIRKTIYPSELQQYLDDGWKKGKKPNK